MTRNRPLCRDSRWRKYFISTLVLSVVLWLTPALGQGLEPDLEGIQPEQPEETGPIRRQLPAMSGKSLVSPAYFVEALDGGGKQGGI